jgi:hypothetical protein
MSSSYLDAVIHLLEMIFGYEVGGPLFNIVLAVCVLVWVFVGRIFMAMFSSSRGIIAALLALLLPFLLGVLAYVMAEVHLVSLIEQDWLSSVAPWASFGLAILIGICVFSRRIWKLSSGVSIFVYMVATLAGIGAYFGTQVTLGVIEYGEGQVEQREQRLNREFDSEY